MAEGKNPFSMLSSELHLCAMAQASPNKELKSCKPGMVLQDFNSNNGEAEAEGSLCSQGYVERSCLKKRIFERDK